MASARGPSVHLKWAPLKSPAPTGAHVLLYTTEPEALRATLRDAFAFRHVDASEGWLIFALPPAELGVHPAEGPTWESGQRHQLTLMCDDIAATVRELRGKGIEVEGEPADEGSGITVMLHLPGDVEAVLYEPRTRWRSALPRARGLDARVRVAPSRSALQHLYIRVTLPLLV